MKGCLLVILVILYSSIIQADSFDSIIDTSKYIKKDGRKYTWTIMRLGPEIFEVKDRAANKVFLLINKKMSQIDAIYECNRRGRRYYIPEDSDIEASIGHGLLELFQKQNQVGFWGKESTCNGGGYGMFCATLLSMSDGEITQDYRDKEHYVMCVK
jgi:hypothetical protein